MHKNTVLLITLATALSVGQLAQADNDIWDMMNPAWWMGLDDDDDDWRYWRYGPGRYARGWPYGWGGPYGYGWGGPYGGYPGYYGHARHGAWNQSDNTQREPPAPKIPE